MSQHKGTTQKVMRKGVIPFELNTMLNRLKDRAKATKASSEKGKSVQEAKNNAVKFIRNYLNSGFTGGYEGSYAQKPTTTKGTEYIQQNNPLNYNNKPNVTYNNVSTALPNKDVNKPREVPSAGNTKPTTPNNPAPNKVETTSTKAPTPTPTESPTRAPTRTPVRAPRVPGGAAGLGIVSAINANDAIKEAIETGSVAPIGKYALNLATGGTSGAIEQAYNDGAFESAPNANPFGAAWAVTKALVNPTNYWNLIRDAGIATGKNAVDIYNNFADYAWRDNNVPPPPTPTPAPTASEDDNWVIPELPDEISDDSEGDWVIPEKPNEYAKTYVQNKIKEKVNTPAPAPVPTPTPVAPRPTPQEVRARKAQQDEMLRQKMLETAQNPNSSVRRNMPDYFNSSTTLQNYYLNNPDLWGNR